MEMTDAQLLGLYVDKRSQTAFTELVDRHAGLVYHAALRRVGGDRQLAEDVSQKVFSDLARKAESLQGRAALAGWLYTSTRFAASEAVRGEKRRQAREIDAEAMKQLHPSSAPAWDQLRPVIDDAMDELSVEDREAIILRYFEERSFSEVGDRIALGADAARMRIGRALDKLRSALVRRGIVSTSAALAEAFAAQSGVAAPIGLTGRIVSGVFSTSASTSATVLAGWKLVTLAGIGVLAIGWIAFGDIPGVGGASLELSPNAPPSAHATTSGNFPVPDVAKATADGASLVKEPTSPAGTYSLASFSDYQKALLKRLWTIERQHPDDPFSRWGVLPGPAFSKSYEMQADVISLQADGWVAVGPKKGVIYLTMRGIAFCKAHSDELDALKPAP
jgi:RNA polymerase sigma factor (sigma-70 family)